MAPPRATDLRRALLAGREAFDDTRLSLDAMLESFRYGHGGVLAKLLGGPHIDRVLFAATKADHVPDVQRDHLAELLRSLAAFPALEVRSTSARIDVAALAAVVSTAGNLLFFGDPEGNFSALNARTGETLWTFQTGSGHRGGPISYSVNGKQYVATPSGWGSTAGARLGEFFPELVGNRRGATIFAFKLPD